MEYDPPLFDGATSEERLVNNAVLFLVLGSVVCTLVSSVIRGVSASPVHLLFGASVSVFTLCLRKLIKWWNIGDLDPKFKWLILAQAASLLLLCIVANIYIWAAPNCSACLV